MVASKLGFTGGGHERGGAGAAVHVQFVRVQERDGATRHEYHQ
jgi:hypothetical protein